LRRLVPKTDLERAAPPNYLFASGHAKRYNPFGVAALYVAEDAATAGAEWDRIAAKLGIHLPQVLYTVEASVSVLDLGDPAVLAALQLTPAIMAEPWEFVAGPTATQRLGQAVADQRRFGGIRFPSDATRTRGFAGFNLVLFREAIVSPLFVAIRDDQGKEVQRWPFPQ